MKASNPPILIFGCGNMDQKRQVNIAILQREACFQKEVSCFGEKSQSWRNESFSRRLDAMRDRIVSHWVKALKNEVNLKYE